MEPAKFRIRVIEQGTACPPLISNIIKDNREAETIQLKDGKLVIRGNAEESVVTIVDELGRKLTQENIKSNSTSFIDINDIKGFFIINVRNERNYFSKKFYR